VRLIINRWLEEVWEENKDQRNNFLLEFKCNDPNEGTNQRELREKIQE